MTKDELIESLNDYMNGQYTFTEETHDAALRIALATLKITKNGYAIVSKEYGDLIAKTMKDLLVDIDESYKDSTGKTDLDKILNELE